MLRRGLLRKDAKTKRGRDITISMIAIPKRAFTAPRCCDFVVVRIETLRAMMRHMIALAIGGQAWNRNKYRILTALLSVSRGANSILQVSVTESYDNTGVGFSWKEIRVTIAKVHEPIT